MDMTPFLQLASILIVILFAAKLAGYLSRRIGQPSVLGELLVGLILGPSLLNITHLPFVTDAHLTETIIQYGDLGVLLLMFLAGMELNPKELAGQFKVSALAGTLGVVFPVLLGWGAGLLLGMDTSTAIFLGLTMGATSVSISAQTLMEMKVLRSRVGLGMLGAAVFDDVLVIVILSIFLAVLNGGSSVLAIVWIFVKILIFLGLSVALGLWALPKLFHLVNRLSVSQGVLTLALIVMLVYGIGAELIGGMAAITGTFIAGLMFARSPEKHRLESGFQAIGYGFFIPIFFISIGLNMNLRELRLDALWLLLIMCVLGILGKVLGSGLGARIAGMSWLQSVQLGAGMISRGEVGLIVASVGHAQGLVSTSEFSAVVGMVVISTLVTPPLLRLLFSKSAPVDGAGLRNKETV
jgi:Kef-type K+ transport system membrane component KefB